MMKTNMTWVGGRRVAAASLLLAALASGGAGCSDDSSSLLVESETTLSLLALRNEGETEWTSVAIDGRKSIELEVADRYELVTVCERAGLRSRVTATHYSRAIDDGDELVGLCRAAPLVVSGTMAQPGEVAIGGAAIASPNAGWSFQLEMKRGTFDLFLFAADDDFELQSFGVRRGVAVNSDLNLGTIDLTQESMQPLVRRTYRVSNALPDESNGAFPWLVSGDVEFPLITAATEWTAALVPATALNADEHQVIQLVAGTLTFEPGQPTYNRGLMVQPDTTAPIALPARIGLPLFDHQSQERRTTATWSTLPEHDELRFFRDFFPLGQPRLYHEARMTRSYAAATEATQLELDFGAIPGFKPEWQQPANAELTLTLSADTGNSVVEGSAFSSVMMDAPLPITTQSRSPIPRTPLARDPEQLRRLME